MKRPIRSNVKRVGPGSRKKRPVMTQDEVNRLQRLLRTDKRLAEKAQDAKEEFDAAHADGVDCLKSGDYQGMEKAIQRERSAVGKFAAATERHTKLTVRK